MSSDALIVAILVGLPDWLDVDFVIAVATLVAVLTTVFALRESQEQRRKNLLPVLLVELFYVDRDGQEGAAARWNPEESGIRISNVGPGVAVKVESTWEYDRQLPHDALRIDNTTAPAIGPGAHHDNEISVLDRFGILGVHMDDPPTRPPESRDVPVGWLEIKYRDIYDRKGITRNYVVVELGERDRLRCEQLTLELPGMQTGLLSRVMSRLR